MCWVGYPPRSVLAEKPVETLLLRLAVACGAAPGWPRLYTACPGPVPRAWMKRGVATPKLLGTRPWRGGGRDVPAASAAVAVAASRGSPADAETAALDAALDALEAIPGALRSHTRLEAGVVDAEGLPVEGTRATRLWVMAALVLPRGREAEALAASAALARSLPRRLRGRGLPVYRLVTFARGVGGGDRA